MAASTIAPTAIAIPPNDMMLDVRPIIFMGMNAMMTATGMVTIGMVALGMCQRKIMMTIATMISSSMRVCFRFSMDRRISSDRSYAVTTFTPQNQFGPIVCGDHFHTRRKSALNIFEFLFDALNHLQRVFSLPHDDNAGDSLTCPVPIRHAAADVGAECHVTHVRDEDRATAG